MGLPLFIPGDGSVKTTPFTLSLSTEMAGEEWCYC